MSYFLSSQNLEIGKATLMSGQEALHILGSRRMKKGEALSLQGPDGKRYKTEILEVNKKTLKFIALESLPVPPEPKISVSLFQGATAENAWDLILQKAVELGADKIYLFSSQNSPKQLSQEYFEKKFLRWEKILWEAAKQSGRGQIPELVFLNSFDRALDKAKGFDKIYLCDAEGSSQAPKTSNLKPVALVVGPEGGFTQEETDKIKTLPNCQLLKLSNFTLRSETAAIAGLSLIINY